MIYLRPDISSNMYFNETHVVLCVNIFLFGLKDIVLVE